VGDRHADQRVDRLLLVDELLPVGEFFPKQRFTLAVKSRYSALLLNCPEPGRQGMRDD
jgi:hypothetical protein